jgi:hypothetical protein
MSEQTADLVDEVADEQVVSEEAETEEEETEVEATEEAEESTEAEADEEAEAEEETDEEEEPEVIEFDFGGNKLELPKGSVPEELADEIDKFTKGTWGDYTRKSQDIADRSKSLEAREKAVEQMSTLNDEALNTYAQALHLQNELKQLQEVDLTTLWQSENPDDRDRARQFSDTISKKQAELQTTIAQVSEKEQELTKAQADELARRTDEGKKLVERRVKGFKPDEVIEYVVKEYGMTREQAETWPLNPHTAEMAHKAMMFDRMQAKAKKPAAKKPAKPVKTPKAKGQAKAVVDPDKMNPAQWLEWRNKQLAARQ